MIVSRTYARPKLLNARYAYAALLAGLAIAVFYTSFVLLDRQAAPSLARGTGMYLPEGAQTPFRWTGSLAEFALAPHSGPTRLSLVLRFASWPERPETQVRLESDAGALASFAVGAASQHIELLLPPGATFLRLRATLGRAPGDWRWLGVQVLSIDAAPSGLPTKSLALALLCALASVPLAWSFVWAARHGYGPIAAITLLGLALRLLWIADSPPLLHRDEAVSLVDAWHLARTGRDHMGHLLPIAAFEAYGDWVSPLLTYLLVPWVALFGPDPLVARIVVAVFAALAIPAIYGLVRELRLPVAAICAALVMALSPWQIFLSRVAIPPALVAATLTLCLWAAVRFIRLGRQRDAFALAVAAGLTLYAYPTMKLAVPLLVLLATGLALRVHGWRALARWGWPALVLGGLWLPFVISTLFNPESSARLQLVAIKADSIGQWLAIWWKNYSVYFRPKLYYGSGGIRKIVQGVPGHGLALSVEEVLLLGIVALPVWGAVRRWNSRGTPAGSNATAGEEPAPLPIWLFLLLAVLIAPLPASLTTGNPNTFRASALAPLYALVVGIGAAMEWRLLGLLPRFARPIARALAATTIAAVLVWQSSGWYQKLIYDYPVKAESTWFFADSEIATMQRIIDYAPQYDQVLIDATSIGRPYIFLLASQALSPADAQAQIVVERQPPGINGVPQLGRYHFGDFVSLHVPEDLPTLEAIPTRNGLPGYLIQEWRRNGQRLLIARGMLIEIAPAANDESADDGSPP